MTVRKGNGIIAAGLILLCCVAILFFVMRYIRYDSYWDKVGRNAEQVVLLMGQPNSVEENEEIKKVYYDKMTYLYAGKNHEEVYLVILEDKNIRFGLFNIGIGTPKYVVEAIYFLKDKIKDLDQNDYGIVDGELNVIYEFDDNEKVKKIYLSDHLFVF